MNRAGLAMLEKRERRRRRRGDLGSGARWIRVSIARTAANIVRSIVLPAKGTAIEVRGARVSMPGGRGGMFTGIVFFLEIRSFSERVDEAC